MKTNILIHLTIGLILISSGTSAQWSLTGNSGTNATSNFIGTTDNTNLKIRTNNNIRLNITSSGKVAIGNFSPVFRLDVKGGSINTDSVYRIKGNTVVSVNGSENTWVGRNCGDVNTIGSMNSTCGFAALYSNIDGHNNTANGAYALFSNSGGFLNTAVGSSALYSNTTGTQNMATGSNALYWNTEGSGNTAEGYAAMNKTTIGYNNTATGSFSLSNNTEGFSNTAVGNHALSSNTTGFSNTAIGQNTNTSIGTLSYATAIGAEAIVNTFDKVRIGDAGISVVEGQVAYSWPSDGRFKENIKDDVKGLDFILKLQPVSYNFNRLKYARHIMEHLTPEREKSLVEKSQNRSVGFIAQDVEKLIQQTAFTAFDAVHAPTNETDNYSMGYAEFVVPLVKAVQELNRKIETLSNENSQLTWRIESLEGKNRIENKNQDIQSNNSESVLQQNNPNPFKENTTISFYISAASENASIKIFSMNGEELKSFPIDTKGKGQIVIAGNTLRQGVYTYVLIVDRKSIDTKQMVITK